MVSYTGFDRYGPRHFLGQLLGGIGGAIGSIIGANEQKKAFEKANAANEARYLRALGEHDRAFGIAKQLLGQAETQFGQNIGIADKAASQSRAEIEKVGRERQRSILEREQQQQAQARQTLTSRGLGNTTVLANAERGIGFDTNRALNQLAEQIALLRAGNIFSGAQMRMGARSAMGDFFMRSAMMQTGLIQNKINTIVSRQDIPNPYAGRFWLGLGKAGGQIGAGIQGWIDQLGAAGDAAGAAAGGA